MVEEMDGAWWVRWAGEKVVETFNKIEADCLSHKNLSWYGSCAPWNWHRPSSFWHSEGFPSSPCPRWLTTWSMLEEIGWKKWSWGDNGQIFHFFQELDFSGFSVLKPGSPWKMRGVVLLVWGPTWKSQASSLVTYHWLELSHIVTPSCKWVWEIKIFILGDPVPS